MVGLVLAVGQMVVVLATRMMAVDLMVKVMYEVGYFGRGFIASGCFGSLGEAKKTIPKIS